MNTSKPTWNNIRYFFENIFFIANQSIDNQCNILVKGISKLHKNILKLLHVPINVFNIEGINWWQFQLTT